MARLFRDCPEAIARDAPTCSRRIDFTLDELRYEYPHEPVPPGWEPQAWLEHLVMAGGAASAIPTALPAKVREAAARGIRADPQARITPIIS